MSRLYAWIGSDTRKTILTTRGNKYIGVTINYGSKHDSKIAIRVLVEYPKNEGIPHIHLKTPKNVKVYTHEITDS